MCPVPDKITDLAEVAREGCLVAWDLHATLNLPPSWRRGPRTGVPDFGVVFDGDGTRWSRLRPAGRLVKRPGDGGFVAKAVILAGGLGSRMGGVYDRPKPLLEIGGQPVVSHVIDVYLDAGTTDFVLCCGHRFADFVAWLDSTAHHGAPQVSGPERRYVLDRAGQRYTVTLVDTGESTHSGGRLRRVGEHLDAFFLTYADGLADVDLAAAASFHAATGAAVTVTAVPLALQFGVMEVDPGAHFARTFNEKPVLRDHWCNCGYYTVDPDVVATTCTGDAVSWESDVLPRLAEEGRLAVVRHAGFWASMDFPHQYESLQETWRAQGAVWRRNAVEDAG